MSDELARAVFVASFPPIQSAIKRTGNGDGMRVQLDIPENEMAEGIKLFGMVGKRLRITVEVWTQLDDEAQKSAEGSGDSVDSRRSTKRRDKRAGG